MAPSKRSARESRHSRGPAALEIFKSNEAFKKSGFALRSESEKPTPEILDRASKNLDLLLADGTKGFPHEDEIAKLVRARVPDLKSTLTPLPSD